MCSTWSTVSRSNSDGWPEPNSDGAGQPDNKDSWPVTTQSSSAAFTDLVPEFEPGKPWKVTACLAHGTCKIYFWSSGESSWLHNGDVLCFL
jgi:hypothetical protein